MPLFIVRVEFEYAVQAKSRRDAISWAEEAARDSGIEDYAIAHKVTPESRQKYPKGWNADCLIYGDCEDDTTLGDALKGIGNETR